MDKLPPLPPEYAHKPEILAWRLDLLQETQSSQGSRIDKLEQPRTSSIATPDITKIKLAAAAILAAAGLTGHAPPWAKELMLKLVGLS